MRPLILLLCVWTMFSQAREIEKVDFADKVSLGTQQLTLNGVGLRTKKKLGMNFKVYVAALYLPAPNKDAKAIVAGSGNKVLELVFLRSVDRETLQEAWQEGFDKNCGSHCENARDQLKAFNDSMVDVKENSRLKITFDKDGVTLELKGAKLNKNAQIVGLPFHQALLSIFIGDHPPTTMLKDGLLGL